MQLAEEETRLQGLMNQLAKELKAATDNRANAQAEQNDALKEEPKFDIVQFIGRIFQPKAFKTRLEIANEQLERAQMAVFQTHDKVKQLSAEIRDAQWKVSQQIEKIREIEDDKKVLGDQSQDLRRASEGLGKVDNLLQLCSHFWTAMNTACATMQKKLEHPQKTFLKSDLQRYKKKFLKAFEDGIEFWKVFVEVSEKYLTHGESAAVAYKFLDGTVDHVSRGQREARLQILQKETSALAIQLPGIDM
jgi:DNA repair exonuclease SbcCD ATPase subunit